MIQSPDGYALLFVILTLAVSSILGATLMIITSNTMNLSANERSDQSAYYIAEAGINLKRAELNTLLHDAYNETNTEYQALATQEEKQAYDFESKFLSRSNTKIVETTTTFYDFEKVFGIQPYATVTITKLSNTPLQYEITSTGTIGDNVRTLSQIYSIQLNTETTTFPNSFNYTGKFAVHARKTISTSGNIEINGAVAVEKSSESETTEEATNRISIQKGTVEKFATYNSIVDSKILLQDLQSLPYPPEFPDGRLLISQNYTLTMQENMRLEEISITQSNVTLTIDVGNSKKELYVNNLNLNKSNFVIKGDGQLILHIGSSLTTTSQFRINCPDTQVVNGVICGNHDPNKLIIIHHSNQLLSIPSQSYINTQLYYAPNIDIDFKGGSFFRGSIVVNSFLGGGTGEVQFTSEVGEIQFYDGANESFEEVTDITIKSGNIKEE